MNTPDFLKAVIEHAAYSVWWTTETIVVATAPMLILGIILRLLMRFTQNQLERHLGRIAMYLVAPLGVIVHELSHYISMRLTGQQVEKAKLYAPDPKTGQLGYVQPTPSNENNPTIWLSRVITSLSPILGGTLILFLLTRFLVPDFKLPDAQIASSHLFAAEVQADSVHYAFYPEDWIGYLWDLLQQLIATVDWRSPRGLIYGYSVFSVASHMAPSSQDLRVARRALVSAILVIAPFLAFSSLLSHRGTATIVMAAAPPVAGLTSIMNLAAAISAGVFLLTFLVTLPLAILRRLLSG